MLGTDSKTEIRVGKEQSAEQNVLPAFQASASFLSRLFSSPFTAILVIISCSCLIFGRSLTSYFLADDIGELRYIQQIFQGDWALFWSNFTGNYMQVPNMAVYRPVLLLTLVLDYAVWKGNAAGYYFSNLFYFTASACLLYQFLRQICRDWGALRSNLAGILAALLFVCNPLHCESVSWVVGRVDSACCMFYLAALCLFEHSTRSRRRLLWTCLGLLAFVCAVCTKEMAIGFSAVLFVLALFFPEKSAAGSDLRLLQACRQRIISAWNFSSPAIYATAGYFLLRYLTLGTILGGYQGSVGAGQTANAIARWLDLDSWKRLLLPFAQDIFSGAHYEQPSLLFVYFLLSALVLLRMLAGAVPGRQLAFLAVWAITLAAPIYRLFGIGENLEGARFCFFLTLALSAFFPVAILAPAKKLPRAFSLRLCALGIMLILAAAGILAKAAYSTNLLWVHAGKEVKAVQKEALKLASSCPSGEKILLLGIPKRHACAHMILNGPTFQMLLTEPFVKAKNAEVFCTFDSILFGDEAIIDGARLSALANQPSYRGPYIWSRIEKRFKYLPLEKAKNASAIEFPLNLDRQLHDKAFVQPYSYGHARYLPGKNGLKLISAKDGDGLELSGVSINPLDYSGIKIVFSASAKNIDLPFQVRWQAAGDAVCLAEYLPLSFMDKKLRASGAASEAELYQIYIPLARNWRWYTQSRIGSIFLSLPALEQIELRRIAILPAKDAAPQLSFAGQTNASGSSIVDRSVPSMLTVSSRNGSSVLLELSRKEFFFDALEQTSKDAIAAAVPVVLDKSSGSAVLDLNKVFAAELRQSGNYQLRAIALDPDSRQVADYSDPVTLFVQSGN